MNHDNCHHQIKCEAKNCIYNDKECNCHAEHIEVGYKSSCSSSETACTTFKAND